RRRRRQGQGRGAHGPGDVEADRRHGAAPGLQAAILRLCPMAGLRHIALAALFAAIAVLPCGAALASDTPARVEHWRQVCDDDLNPPIAGCFVRSTAYFSDDREIALVVGPAERSK